MKKTIKILGIVLGIHSIIGGLLFLFVGIYALLNQEALRQSATFLSRLNDEQYLSLCVFYIILGPIYLSGSVFDFIHSAIVYRDTIGKGVGITLGVVGAIAGAPITGALTIVDSALHRK